MPKSAEALITEIHTDMKWVKSSLNQKANKWTEKVLSLMMVGVGAWVLAQIFGLIEAANAVFN